MKGGVIKKARLIPVHGDRDARNFSFSTALTKSCMCIVERSVSEQVEALGVAGLLCLRPQTSSEALTKFQASKIVVRKKHTRGLPSSRVFTHCRGRPKKMGGRSEIKVVVASENKLSRIFFKESKRKHE